MDILHSSIRFRANDPVQRKYAIVDKDIDVDTVVKDLMTEKWKLPICNLLISVTGGAKEFSMSNRLTEVFQNELRKVIQYTGAWIITAGTDKGVMKIVGDALKDYKMTSAQRESLVAIGIATYGIVQRSEDLKQHAEETWNKTIKYYTTTMKGDVHLDSNHTHFILVKGHTQIKYEGEIKFREKLEKKLGKMSSVKGSVPVVLLVLDGGINTLKTVKEAVDINTPVVIISGSGRVADVLAYAYEKMKMNNDPDSDIGQRHKDDIVQKLENIKGIGKEHALKAAETVVSIMTHKNISTWGGEDLDVAILQSLMKDYGDKFKQLKLALALNRIDIAKNDICKDDDQLMEQSEIYTIAQKAILEDKVEFVQMFLDKGMNAEQFLTLERLVLIYNQSKAPFRTLLPKVNRKSSDDVSLIDIGHLIQYLIGDFYKPIYLKTNTDINFSLTKENAWQGREAKLKKPFKHLFMWCILMNRQDMAKMFWKYCNDKTAAALVGCGILQKMSDKAESKGNLMSNALEFSALAREMMDDCNDDDEIKTHDLLETTMDDWSEDTCLRLAVGTDNKEFISHTACQSLLNKKWMGKLSQHNSVWKVVVSVIFFPLLFFLKYVTEDTHNASGSNKNIPTIKNETFKSLLQNDSDNDIRYHGNNSGTQLTICQKLCTFYTAPFVVFVLNAMSYTAFLVLYSYYLLVDLRPDISNIDIVLITWVVTLTLEEIRQLITGPSKSMRSKFRIYINDPWNVLDVITISLFTLGMTIRISSLEVARIVLGINLITFFLRILRIFSLFKKLGPKLIMIAKMFRDFLYFSVIFLVFLVAYAIATHSILFPNADANSELITQVFKAAYWNLYGELFLDELEQKPPLCTFDPALYANNTLPRCPSKTGVYVGHIMLGVYVFFSNILLLNILIAMFSYTFKNVQKNTNLVWCFERYHLINEYCSRPSLPPPFLVIIHFYRMIRKAKHKLCSSPNPNTADKSYAKRLQKWEKDLADNVLQRKEREEHERGDKRVSDIQQKNAKVIAKLIAQEIGYLLQIHAYNARRYAHKAVGIFCENLAWKVNKYSVSRYQQISTSTVENILGVHYEASD